MPKKVDISKIRHPNSRKVRNLVKEKKKIENKKKNKLVQSIKNNIIGEKLLWFQKHLNPNIECYDLLHMQNLIESYLRRFDAELEQIQLKHSVGQRTNRQHANREDVINMTIKREREEYNTCGIEVPDIMNPKQLEMLKNWNGELRYLQNFLLKRVNNKNQETVSNKILTTNDDEQVAHADKSNKMDSE